MIKAAFGTYKILNTENVARSYSRSDTAKNDTEVMKMGKALIIGAGGVASVCIHKCCQNPDVFEEICIASRTK